MKIRIVMEIDTDELPQFCRRDINEEDVRECIKEISGPDIRQIRDAYGKKHKDEYYSEDKGWNGEFFDKTTQIWREKLEIIFSLIESARVRKID